jgi:hypothetical protein
MQAKEAEGKDGDNCKFSTGSIQDIAKVDAAAQT